MIEPTTSDAPADPTPERPAGPPAAAIPDPVRRIGEYVFYGSMSWLAWFWGASVLLWIAAMVVVPQVAELETSMWEFLGLGWMRWVLFAAGCVLGYSSFPMLVAQGLTRRRVAQGSIAGIAAIAVAGALIVTAVYAVEGIVFGLLDIDLVVSERHLFDVPGQLWWVAIEALLVGAMYLASGWFIALGFYRWNNVIGVLMIVPGLIPVVIVEAVLSSSLLPENVDEVFLDVPGAVAITVTVVTFVATVAVAGRIMRDTPLRTRPR
jgi:ABC-type transport system involved in cytochrome c biogenesis permease component